MTDPQINQNAASEGTSESPCSVFDKYNNPDRRCGYPFTPDPCGYCWSYAHHVDGTKGYEEMEKICPRCELFTPNIGLCVKTHSREDTDAR